ncbi:hypothetical protein GOP47_0002801 [Adiantum capillus-veneris]|uniref:Uncharacterized protein n=1 Tax=Adiantum capillus-veneris TaxID=13818 RepID=A0A9D4VCH2_ADICA|nr:hypothetical protein GOP47_0002801 [Adiantum capillus-veneris]
MAYDVLCESGVETPFVWTEGAHSLYLTFLEEAFVNDLYLRQYCSPDICGCSPPFPSALADSTATAAESPPSAPPQIPSMVVSPRSKPQSRPETKTRRRCPRPSAKVSSLKKKGKWPSQDEAARILIMSFPKFLKRLPNDHEQKPRWRVLTGWGLTRLSPQITIMASNWERGVWTWMLDKVLFHHLWIRDLQFKKWGSTLGTKERRSVTNVRGSDCRDLEEGHNLFIATSRIKFT